MHSFSKLNKYFTRKIIAAIIALLLYVIPGFVQDVHRLEHIQGNASLIGSSDEQISLLSEKCPICKYEFCPVSEQQNSSILPAIFAGEPVFISSIDSQLATPVFNHFRLRGPPVS
jgi:hypothetical protein